ncbi:MAG: hypothetical protein PHQ75_09535, partial [Thermoguttaceae bacterium]|nr:hypothetical protein [Thermoguttaceae bacterium]
MGLPSLPQHSAPQIPSSQVPERKPGGGSDLLFIIALTFLLLWVLNRFNPPADTKAPVVPQETQQDASLSKLPVPGPQTKLPQEIVQAAKQNIGPKFITLGSLDSMSEYRMLVTLSNRGAAVARLELNEKSYRDTHDRTGYFGQIVVDESIATEEFGKQWPGVAVQVVGPGTPIEKAGVKQGDRIVSMALAGQAPIAIDSFNTLRTALLETRPGQKITLEYLPQKEVASLKEKTAAAFSSLKARRVELELQAAPVSILRPEGLVRSYNDYQNLRGLQGATPLDDASQRSSSQVMKTPEKKKPLVKPNQTPEVSKAEPATTDKTSDKKADVVSSEKSGEKSTPKEATAADSKSTSSDSSVTFVSAGEVIDLDRHLADPERKLNSDPLSFMLTLGEYDEVGKLKWYPDTSKTTHTSQVRSSVVGTELPETQLRDGYWEYLQSDSDENTAVFRKILLPYNLEIRKTYSLVKGAAPNAKGRKERYAHEYHLTLRVDVVNLDSANSHKVSYLLDGPTGLPIEGAWYSSGRKTGPGWGVYGLRDLVLQMKGKPVQVVKCSDVANDLKTASDKVVLDYIGVDTQYFQCTMIPVRQDAANGWHEGYSPLRVGSRDKDLPDVTNVSFRLKSNAAQLAP